MVDLQVAPLPQDRGRGAVVCVPTYDEVDNIAVLLDRVLSCTCADVLVIDDNSPDGTADVVQAHRLFDERVFLLRRPGKGGLGAAYRAGFAWALDNGYDVVAQMDADLSHPAEALPEMIARTPVGDLGGRADVVIGSRYVVGGRTVNWPWRRQLISRAGNLYVRLVLGLRTRDATAGFRVYTAKALRDLDVASSSSDGYAFQVENTWRAVKAELRIEEHPITFVERQSGQSKMSGRIVREAMSRVLLWRWAQWRSRLSRTRAARAGTAGA